MEDPRIQALLDEFRTRLEALLREDAITRLQRELGKVPIPGNKEAAPAPKKPAPAKMSTGPKSKDPMAGLIAALERAGAGGRLQMELASELGIHQKKAFDVLVNKARKEGLVTTSGGGRHGPFRIVLATAEPAVKAVKPSKKSAPKPSADWDTRIAALVSYAKGGGKDGLSNQELRAKLQLEKSRFQALIAKAKNKGVIKTVGERSKQRTVAV